jgi:hypothetical protein
MWSCQTTVVVVCHVVCRTQNCTELASTPPISPCDQRVLGPPIWHYPLPPFSSPITDSRAHNLLGHQLHLCTRTPTVRWFLKCVGRVVQDRNRQQHKNGPVVRLYLWKEWKTHTVVDASSTLTLTFPFSSSHNVRSLPPRIGPLVLLWISKNPIGGFPETHLAISHDERDVTEYWQSLISSGRRTSHGGSGKVHCLNVKVELLKL